MDEQQSHSEDEAAVRAVFESWTAAVRRRDIAGILENHSSDIVMFDVPPPFQLKGLAAYEKSWAEPGPNGAQKPLDFRLTVGFRKIGGRWTVTHEHHSVPAAD